MWCHDFFAFRDVHSQRVLSARGNLTALFVCHRTVSMAAVYQLKIKYDQDKFGAVLWQTKRAESFLLEDKTRCE